MTLPASGWEPHPLGLQQTRLSGMRTPEDTQDKGVNFGALRAGVGGTGLTLAVSSLLHLAPVLLGLERAKKQGL